MLMPRACCVYWQETKLRFLDAQKKHLIIVLDIQPARQRADLGKAHGWLTCAQAC